MNNEENKLKEALELSDLLHSERKDEIIEGLEEKLNEISEEFVKTNTFYGSQHIRYLLKERIKRIREIVKSLLNIDLNYIERAKILFSDNIYQEILKRVSNTIKLEIEFARNKMLHFCRNWPSSKSYLELINQELDNKKDILIKNVERDILIHKMKSELEVKKSIKNPKIFLSYSHKDKEIADRVDNFFNSKNIQLTRDVRDIPAYSSLTKFMDTIRDHDYVIMLISDAYLKSTNCMYEVIQFIQEKNYVEKTFPIIIDKKADIFKKEKHIDYISFWQNEYKSFRDKINDLENTGTNQSHVELDKIDEIRLKIGKFLNKIADLKCFSLDKLESTNYKAILDKITETFVGDKWRISRTDNIRYIAPTEKETSFDFQTYGELAYRLSSLGKFDKSIECAEKAQKHWKNQKKYLEAASMALFIAIQYRHQGIFRKTLENYALAETFIFKVKKETPKLMLTKWRINAGKVLVEYNLIKGNCKRTYKEYNELIKVTDNYLIENQQIDDNSKKKIGLYKIHAIRQQAEMQRLLGKYNKALKLFRKVYKQYNYIYAEEKACSVLGQGDCLRMLGKFDDAMIKYEVAMEFAREKRNSRLQIRVLRNMAELYRANGRDIRKLLEEIKKLSNETNHLFGKLYYFLIEGGLHLKEDLEKAEEFFRKANKLTQINEEPLKIEYAHSIFGLAEVKRLKKDTNAAEDYYNKAYKLYKETGILWGIIRTKIGIAMTNGSNSEQERLINLFKNSDHLIAKLSENKLKQDEILFLNIP